MGHIANGRFTQALVRLRSWPDDENMYHLTVMSQNEELCLSMGVAPLLSTILHMSSHHVPKDQHSQDGHADYRQYWF